MRVVQLGSPLLINKVLFPQLCSNDVTQESVRVLIGFKFIMTESQYQAKVEDSSFPNLSKVLCNVYQIFLSWREGMKFTYTLCSGLQTSDHQICTHDCTYNKHKWEFCITILFLHAIIYNTTLNTGSSGYKQENKVCIYIIEHYATVRVQALTNWELDWHHPEKLKFRKCATLFPGLLCPSFSLGMRVISNFTLHILSLACGLSSAWCCCCCFTLKRTPSPSALLLSVDPVSDQV